MSYALGVDINSRYSQISAYTDLDRAPVPVSAVMGQDRYEIPTMVAFVKERNLWTYGYEAYSLNQAGAAFVVDDLLNKAVKEEVITVNGEEYNAYDLLELFIKKLLGMANMISPYQLADSIVFCVEFLNLEIIRLLNGIINNLGIDPKKTSLMSHSECVHHYMIHQPADLWARDVLVLDYSGSRVLSKLYHKNSSTKPMVCSISERAFPRSILESDEEMSGAVKELLDGNIISSVYLIGDVELDKTCPNALAYLVGKRRAFMGRNLYTRGACFASKDNIMPGEERSKYFFMGRDKVKCNVGVYVNNPEGESFVELIEAGFNWYDVSCSEKFYLGSQREIRLCLKPVDGSGESTAIIRLNDFPKRPDHTTYIKMQIIMDEPDVLTVRIYDLGFGQIFPSSEMMVEEKIDLNEQGI